MKSLPRYPIYIVSKGRSDTRLTSKALENMKVPYYIVIEEQEYELYSSVIDPKKILILDKKYQREYNTCDNLGDSKSKGPGAARNFAWEHSIANGHEWHWVMDDNIRCFYRLNNNLKIQVGDGTVIKCMEDFVNRYTNVGMAGPNYDYFAVSKAKYPPYSMNTRIYSCNLIRNNLPFRWRGRYNEDTDLSLQILKSGLCTVQFYAFLQGKMTTQVMKGGNSADFYFKEGTYPKSKMLVDMHPDISTIKWKFKRWHHHVDYTSFKDIKLIKRKDLRLSEDKINNYGMILKKIK